MAIDQYSERRHGERRLDSQRTACRQALLAGSLLILFAGACSLRAQEVVPDSGQASRPLTVDRTLTTLHGVVRNATSGEGVPRALVRIEGDADTGALTDGDGRFEIADIPVGPQQVDVTKPGFLDRISAAAGTDNGEQQALMGMSSGHNVMVAAEMPDVVFTLAPAGAIRGQIELSTGDSAQGITVALAKRTIENGRAVWQESSTTRTRSDGTFRFGGLADGDYAVYSQPAMDNDLDDTTGQAGTGPRWGYASAYYPEARDASGMARIHVTNGGEAQANLTLTLEPFQAVRAALILPQSNASGRNLSAMVIDSAGRALPYQALYDQDSHRIEAELPDGSYTILVQSKPAMERRGSEGNLNAAIMVGSVDFSVAGRALPNLRVALGSPRPSPVLLNVIHNATQPAQMQGRGSQVQILVSQAGGWIDDAMVSAYADGTLPGPLEAVYTKPGSYWVHTHIQQKGLCESSFTAGGVKLGHEPVVMGRSGPLAPMELALRDDCAQLQVSLPDNAASITAGEERFFSVYVVPDFDSTADIEPLILRPSTGGTLTVSDLTPGNYHVYTFAGYVQLAYRNRDALAALPNPGQAITLSPGTTGNLVVEAPAR